MSDLFHWDELNFLRQDAVQFIRDARQKKPDRGAIDGFLDYMEFVLCLIYMYGWHDAEEIVGTVPFADGLDDRSVNLEIKGETFRQRVERQIDELSEEGILRIIETESHRDYNTGVVDAGLSSGKSARKTWNTMLDDRVRETHDYLEGMTVDIGDSFYTYDGDSAMYPGGFSLPENNVNCRCYVTLTM